MKIAFYPWQSLKTRVTLYTLTILIVSIWSLSFFASHNIRADMQRTIGEQQFLTASYVASSLDYALSLRMSSLETLAQSTSPLLSSNPGRVQAFLEQRQMLHKLLNGGVMVLNTDGVAIADSLPGARRIGTNYAALSHIASALKQGFSKIGEPIVGLRIGSPIIGMAVPIRDNNGKIIGALSGAVDLGKPNFLDVITQTPQSQSNSHLILVARNQRLTITASDKQRIMESLPVQGRIPELDRLLQSSGGTEVLLNSRGVEILVSAKGITAAPWDVLIAIPTATAFAPIESLQDSVFFATLLLSVLAGLSTWWLLHRELLPLNLAANKLEIMGNAHQRLPVVRDDEIGQLVSGFNNLLATVERNHGDLQEKEFRWKFAIEGANIGVWDWNLETGKTRYSKIWKEMLGYTESDEFSDPQDFLKLLHPDDRESVQQAEQAYLNGTANAYDIEFRMQCKDSSYKWVGSRGIVVSRDNVGKPTRMIGTHMDISLRKRSEERLRIAAASFESQQGTLITDADGVILHVNRAFTATTGYSAEEVIGETPKILQSGRHPREFYRAMWDKLLRAGQWQGEIWDKRKNGEHYPVWLTISSVTDLHGKVTHFVGAHHEISERKKAEVAMMQLNTELRNSRQLLRSMAAQGELNREEERKRVAREVHDELGQVLTALRMELSTLAMQFGPQAPGLPEDVQAMKGLVDRAIQGVRTVATNLRPTSLDMGLLPALEWLCDDFMQRTSIQCLFRATDSSIELDEARSIVIFRIVQESLTNITKYADATEVFVTMGLDGNELGLEVRDNGMGFDPKAAASGKSYGLLGMSERAIALGGHIDIVSAPGKGTVIGVSIPIDLDVRKGMRS